MCKPRANAGHGTFEFPKGCAKLKGGADVQITKMPAKNRARASGDALSRAAIRCCLTLLLTLHPEVAFVEATLLEAACVAARITVLVGVESGSTNL